MNVKFGKDMHGEIKVGWVEGDVWLEGLGGILWVDFGVVGMRERWGVWP